MKRSRKKSKSRRKSKKRRSGNGTNARQYLYLLVNFWYNVSSFSVLAGVSGGLYLYYGNLSLAMGGIAFGCSVLASLGPIKIGITGDKETRISTIDRSSPGRTVTLFCRKINRAYPIEQWLHNRLALFRRDWYGSGRTEYFYLVAILLAYPTILTIWLIDRLVFLILIIAASGAILYALKIANEIQ